MLFKKTPNNPFAELLEESRKLSDRFQNNDFSGSIRPSAGSPETKDIAENINNALEMMRKKIENLEVRFDLVTQAMEVGLWDMHIVEGDPLNPNNKLIWTNGLRKMLGYQDETDFPNVLDSWLSKLHPEDRDLTLLMLSIGCL
jgi:hypothetical protein